MSVKPCSRGGNPQCTRAGGRGATVRRGLPVDAAFLALFCCGVQEIVARPQKIVAGRQLPPFRLPEQGRQIRIFRLQKAVQEAVKMLAPAFIAAEQNLSAGPVHEGPLLSQPSESPMSSAAWKKPSLSPVAPVNAQE